MNFNKLKEKFLKNEMELEIYFDKGNPKVDYLFYLKQFYKWGSQPGNQQTH